MRTLKKHLILFDAECPICNAYTKVLVNKNLLNEEGRSSYQELKPEACPMLNRQRAANEIALVNKETGEVTYGIESLLKIYSVRIPILKQLLLFRPFVHLMSKAYAFIAFNRRVIIPAPTLNNAFQIQPTFRLDYRIAYLVITWGITAFILSHYANLLDGLLPQGKPYREYLICGGQIFFQGSIINFLNREKKWDYLGNMMTISFGGALLLLPGLILSALVNINPIVYCAWFIVVAGLMLLEHIRRSKILAVGGIPTLTWVLYRLIVLLFILYFNV